MIDEIDEALRKLLIRELPVKNGEVEITFDHPNREWSARLSRPTLNLFLYDLRENARLRQTQPAWETERMPDGSALQRRKPFRVDLQYMITAWAPEADDEHRLLSRTLTAMFRFPFLPVDLLAGELVDQNKQIPILVGQGSEMQSLIDIWSVLDNQMHPALSCLLTVSIDPYAPVEVPLVREREVRIGPSRRPGRRQLDAEAGVSSFYTIGGRFTGSSGSDPARLHLTLLEQGLEIPIQPDGSFTIGHLRAGAYTLEAAGEKKPARRYSVSVPGADIELEY
jgi:hypothetical protein